MKNLNLNDGVYFYKNKNTKLERGLDLTIWLNRELGENNVPHVHPCCPCPDEVPVRYNTEDGVMENWDCTTEAWIPLEITTDEFANLSITDILSTSHLGPITGETNVKVDSPFVLGPGTAKAVNVTGAVTATELTGGYITSTSAAPVTITLPTATLFAAAIGAEPGTRFQFLVDNSAGANTVTIDLTGTGISVGTAPITGGGTLTVSVANAIGLFELFFTSTTAAILRRIA